MRKFIAAVAVATSVAAGGLVGGVFGAPMAGAAQTATSAVGWVQTALSGLVDDGTITQQQADAVGAALQEARPERGPGHHGPMHLDTVAEALGMTPEELRTALDGDQTIAEIAAGKGVDVQTVIDAIVADHAARIDEKVAAGRLTQEEADAKRAAATERATAMVNGEMPAFRGGGPGHFGPPPPPALDAPEAGGTES
jgi:uncharacterized protein YidB (DUF937 family)